jgi:hypothetical protein
MMAGTRAIRTARRMVAVFWAFTALYLALSIALLVTRGPFGLIFIALLAYSWFFQGWPDTKPHFKVLRNSRQHQETSSPE